MTSTPRTAQDLARELVAAMKAARDERGSLSVEDLTRVVESVLRTVQQDLAKTDQILHHELEQIAAHIHQARDDMAKGIPSAMSSERISTASSELGAVLEVTEEAAGVIMDAADEIQGAITGSDHYIEKKVTAAVTRIYEACNFQDLAGQRVNKVIRLLGEIETRVARLVSIISGEAPPEEDGDARQGDAALMNGPQAKGAAPSQADIDALFNNL